MIEVPAMTGLTFDEGTHTYRLDGNKIPSVSTVMRALNDSYYGGIDRATLENAARKGRSVHHAVENYHNFDIVDVPEEHKGYLDAYIAWSEKESPMVIATECRVFHKFMRYAGTCDAICVLNGDTLACIDYKTTAQIAEMLIRVQLEAYSKAYESHGMKFDVKQIVHLQKDGRYSVKECGKNDTEAWETFTSLLVVRNYIEKYGR